MILEARGLVKRFPWGRTFGGARGWVRAVEDVSLAADAGETLALVGESGSGKTTTGRILAGLETPTAGEVRFRGERVEGLAGPAWRAYRLGVQMVFQDSQASLNPRKTIAQTLDVALGARGVPAPERRDAAVRLLDEVGMAPADV
ncbi:MAG: ATP-binding cassette domain-containing protein, partial [Armatimonadota bacterium]|nr:ATP-binding cassette domain-containing protein [Armatimonadota bacterium]